MHVGQDAAAQGGSQVCGHVVEDKVHVPIVGRPHHVAQADDVVVVGQFLQEHDLAEGTLEQRWCEVSRVLLRRRPRFFTLSQTLPLPPTHLGVGRVLERVEHLLDGHRAPGEPVHGAPHDAVGL